MVSENQTQRRKGTPLTKGVKPNMGYGTGIFENTSNVGCDQATHVLHVDGKRTDSYTPNGSIALPFKTVQAALDAAIPIFNVNYEDKPGVSIVIAAGRYEEDCAFTFPFPYERLDIRSAGGRDSVILRSLEASACSFSGPADDRNFLNLYNLTLGSETSTVAPIQFHNVGHLHTSVWGCRIDLDGKDIPLCILGDAGGEGSLYAHFYNNCRLYRKDVPHDATTAAIKCLNGDVVVDFQGRVRQSAGYVPMVRAGAGVKFDAQDSSFITSSFAPAFEFSGSAQAILIDSKIDSGAFAGIQHTGSYTGDGALLLLDGVFFYLTTGQAVDASSGALVALGAASWDGALAGYGDITSKITVADPALLKRLQSACATAFAPALAGDWNVAPSDIKTALDELASRVKALEA